MARRKRMSGSMSRNIGSISGMRERRWNEAANKRIAAINRGVREREAYERRALRKISARLRKV